jgi:ferredoxin-NADP reductase
MSSSSASAAVILAGGIGIAPFGSIICQAAKADSWPEISAITACLPAAVVECLRPFLERRIPT